VKRLANILLLTTLLLTVAWAVDYVCLVVPVGTDLNRLVASRWAEYPAITNVVFNQTAEPVTTNAQVWAQDDSTNTELRVMDSAGNITTISPHSTSLFPKQLREKRRLTFTHYEKSVELDYEMNIDMIGFVKFMEKHYNRQWIYSRKLSDPTDTNVVWELDN